MWDRTLAAFIDHTNLKSDASEKDIVQLCKDTIRYGFKTAVVAPVYVPLAVSELSWTGTLVCSVVSFPLGSDTADMKVRGAEELIESGAGEIDMVMNIGGFLSGRFEAVEKEIRRVASVCKGRALLKVIIETAFLDEQGIKKATELVAAGGADFVKTSTGFAPTGARIEDVRIMKAAAGSRLEVKASGGVRTRDFAHELLEAGATRIGCSASVDIVAL